MVDVEQCYHPGPCFPVKYKQGKQATWCARYIVEADKLTTRNETNKQNTGGQPNGFVDRRHSGIVKI